MDDLISRQAAIDALAEHEKSNGHNYTLFVDIVGECAEIIRNLPSAQPEIIYCKDCIWYELPSHRITENCVRWMKSNGILLPIKPNDYCSYAERRTDE